MNKPGYKLTSLGWIPEDWDVKELNAITRKPIVYGIVQAGPHVEDGIPYIKSSDVGSEININNLSRTSLAIAGKYRRSSVMPGDIVFSLRGNIGELSIVPEKLEHANLTQGTARISVLKDNIGYLKYALSGPIIKKIVLIKAKGSTFQEISLEQLRQLPIPLPPLPEQRRIASIFSTWDAVITKEQQLIETLQTRHRALMKQLLNGKRRFKEFKEQWNDVRLGSLGESFNGLTGKSKEQFGQGQPFVTYLNVFFNSKTDLNQVDYVKILENENQNTIQYGDLLFTVSSETPEEVGMTSVVLDNTKGIYLNSFCFGFRLKNFRILLPEYAQFYFRNNEARNAISLLAQGSTRFNISKEGIRNLILRLPPLPEQTAIASVLSTSEKEIQIHRRRLAALQQQKKGLMQVLLTGKVRVKAAEP